MNLRAIAANLFGLWAVAGGAYAHVEIVIAGSEPAGGQLMIHAHFDEPIVLPSAGGDLEGWADSEPPLISIEQDDPRNGLYMLDDGANIVFEVVLFDDAFQLWPGPSPIRNPGDTWVIGAPAFHLNPIWHINSADPAFDPADDPWEATFRVVDTNGVYSPSAAITIPFTRVPEPASLLMAALGLLALGRRSRG